MDLTSKPLANLKQIYLAKCYQKGLGCPKNETLAFKLFKIVSGEGDFQSLYEVGVCYLYGIGCEKDEKEAYICFKISFLVKVISKNIFR